jgi:PPM family protein phosphatase
MSSIRPPRSTARSSIALVEPSASRKPADGKASPGPAVHFAALSDVGSARPHNEDRWQVVPEHGLIIVADGMGGYNAGEVAAELAVQTACQLVPDLLVLGLAPGEALVRGISASNDQIREYALGNPDCLGMGTTIVCAIVAAGQLHLAHIGDSRAYLFRDGQLRRLTRDHSIGQEIVESGKLSEAEVRELPARGILTRALGVEENVVCDSLSLDWLPGDTLVLCSDGLTDLVTDPIIEQLLVDAAPEGPGAQVRSLIGGALQAGGADNVTAVVVRAADGQPSARAKGRVARERAH